MIYIYVSCRNDKWGFLFRKHNISLYILDFSVPKGSSCTFTAIWFHWNSRAHAFGLLAMSFGHQNALVPSRAFETNMKTLIHFSDHSPLHFSTFRQKQRQLATVSYTKKKKKSFENRMTKILNQRNQFLECFGLLPYPQAFALAVPLSRWCPWLIWWTPTYPSDLNLSDLSPEKPLLILLLPQHRWPSLCSSVILC